MLLLLPLMEIVHQVYDVDELGGIYAFLDGFSGQKKSPADYAKLAERGLKRVYVGMESGNETLLQFLKKPGKPADAIKAARAMKAGGVTVGVIVLIGDLVRQGKVRYIGSSTYPAWLVMEALAISERYGLARFVTEQPPYNLLDRRIENELIPLAQRYDLGSSPGRRWRWACWPAATLTPIGRPRDRVSHAWAGCMPGE